MDKDTLLYKGMAPDKEFIEEIFHYDVKKLDSTDGILISKYCIALAQYLIFLRHQTNQTKILVMQKKRLIDGTLDLLLTKDLIKEHGTKTNALTRLKSSSKELISLQTAMEPLQDELLLLEGIDKTISELIAAFKRELTRRENELYATRQERKY